MRNKFILFLLLFISSSVLFAQTVEVTGTVTSKEEGEPLIGVSVFLKGSSTGTATDIDGKYSLKVPLNATLTFSYIGYTPRDITVKKGGQLDVVLSATENVLQEVVAIGYGMMKKHDLTAMFGVTYEETNYYSVSASGSELVNTEPHLQYVNNTPNEIRKNPDGSYYSTRSGGDGVGNGVMSSYLGKLHYAYDNKYLLTASFRYDGSSKFIRGRMWDFFPSMAAARKVSEEEFFELVKDKIDFLKIHAGWGQVGNANSIDQSASVATVERFIA